MNWHIRRKQFIERNSLPKECRERDKLVYRKEVGCKEYLLSEDHKGKGQSAYKKGSDLLKDTYKLKSTEGDNLAYRKEMIYQEALTS